MVTDEAVATALVGTNPRSSQQPAELRLGPLAGGAEHGHHLHVGQVFRRPPPRRVGLDQAFDHQQPRLRPHGRPARPKDPSHVLVRPVVQHADQQVEVGAGRHAVEEAAAVRRDPAAGQRLGRDGRDHVGPVEDEAPRGRVERQDAAQGLAVAAADIGDQAGSAKS